MVVGLDSEIPCETMVDEGDGNDSRYSQELLDDMLGDTTLKVTEAYLTVENQSVALADI